MEPVKPPVELAVMVPGFVAIGEPSSDMVTTEFAIKLLPEMFIVVPVGPLVGFSDIIGVVTVNCAEAEVDDASRALTGCSPAIEDDGTIMEPVKPRGELAVMVSGFVAVGEPSDDMVTT